MSERAQSYELVERSSGNCVEAFAYLTDAKRALEECLCDDPTARHRLALVAFDGEGRPVWHRIPDGSWLAA
jgi:hypothetical protein